MSIEVKGVTKTYGEQKALNEVSFNVKKGEVVGFLGPNGAGKSTMMKIITCFIPPTTGTVSVCGHDTASESMKVRSLVGYLPESNPLYHDMYIKEYLQFVCGIYGLSDVAGRVKNMIELTGLEREQHKQIGQLSKGYKQRVGIAQALIHDPLVLVLDEPTSGLDPNQLVGIRQLIRDLGKEKTVLFSSHIMQEVEAVSDRVIIIDNGKVVADRMVKGGTSESNRNQVLAVAFDKDVELHRLKRLAGVKEAVQKEGEPYSYLISGDADRDLRRIVSEWAREQNLLILEMNTQDEKLEELFMKLTAK